MAAWDDGYVSDVVYTSNFYRECTPAWMSAAALLLGHRPPDLARPFRYADFGCAHGFTAVAIAAAHPNAEVWGFDFNPAHIESARDLAFRSGLSNVHFQEASFADIAEGTEIAGGTFDFAVSHGVLSWISTENRQHLIRAIGRLTKPGGLSYLSYNVLTGWPGMLPLRALMRMLAKASPDRSDLAVPGILDFIDRLKQGGALFFQANPGLETRLAEIRRQDARYIAHEFLNEDWQPVMSAEVATAMTEVKCGFIGSATLPENIDTVSVPAGLGTMMSETRDPVLRETLRDFGAGQGFRRDLFRRGVNTMPTGEHQARVDDLTLVGTGQAAGDQITIPTSIGSVTGRPEIYGPLLAMLADGPMTVRQVRQREPFVSRPLVELLQAVALLFAGGYAHPAFPGVAADAVRAVARLNQVIAASNAGGGDQPRLVSPVMGSAITVDFLETLAVGALLGGHGLDLDALTSTVLGQLTAAGRAVQQEGQAVQDPAEARRIVTALMRGFLDNRVPVLRHLGVLAR